MGSVQSLALDSLTRMYEKGIIETT